MTWLGVEPNKTPFARIQSKLLVVKVNSLHAIGTPLYQIHTRYSTSLLFGQNTKKKIWSYSWGVVSYCGYNFHTD